MKRKEQYSNEEKKEAKELSNGEAAHALDRIEHNLCVAAADIANKKRMQ